MPNWFAAVCLGDECSLQFQKCQTEDDKFICTQGHVYEDFRVIFNFAIEVVDINDDDKVFVSFPFDVLCLRVYTCSLRLCV